MRAHASYAVFTTRADDPPPSLLHDAKVPALDPSAWTIAARPVEPGEPLLEVLRTLAFEREPPIPKRTYPTPQLYRQAVTVEVAREDSLYPDGIGFATGAVSALVAWADGPVVDLTAERVWTAGEWRKWFGRRRPFEPRRHVSVHATWSPDATTATLHTHGMAKWAHPELVALDVPDEGTRAAGQRLGHLAAVRARPATASRWWRSCRWTATTPSSGTSARRRAWSSTTTWRPTRPWRGCSRCCGT
jgi:hypothetical protein